MARVLGVDHGLARTGLAVSDAEQITCRPLETIHERDEGRLADLVAGAARREEADLIVVGIPRPLAGGASDQTRAAESFRRRLADSTELPVIAWDERFTTKLAREGRRRAGGRSGRRDSEDIDSVAACHLLQSYLDSDPGTRSDA